MDRGIADLRALLQSSDQTPRETSLFGFTFLTLTWCLAIGLYAHLAADLSAHPNTVPAGSGIAGAFAAMELFAMRIAPAFWLLWLPLPIVLTYLVLSKSERRTLPRLFVACGIAWAAAVVGVFGLTTQGHVAAAITGMLLCLEGLRIVLAATLHRWRTAPDDPQ